LLIRRRVTSAPSSKTSYVVVGENAGKSKLDKIASLNLKTLTEDGFLELIGTRGGGDLDEKQQKAKEKEEKKVIEQAKAMEAREKEEEKLQKRKMAALSGTGMPAK
jgi:replication factor C subunit 1